MWVDLAYFDPTYFTLILVLVWLAYDKTLIISVFAAQKCMRKEISCVMVYKQNNNKNNDDNNYENLFTNARGRRN